MPPFSIFQISRVPGVVGSVAEVGPLASWIAAEMRRGSIGKPLPPSVLIVHGCSSVPSERPKMKVRWRAWASSALSAGLSRSSGSGIIFSPAGLAGLPLTAGLAGS
ncbi:hypothetical protein D3C78_1191540 [compost metagenome]